MVSNLKSLTPWVTPIPICNSPHNLDPLFVRSSQFLPPPPSRRLPAPPPEGFCSFSWEYFSHVTYLTLKNVFPRLTLKIDFILIQVVEVNREVFTQIEGYAGAANGRSNNYYQYALILNRIYTSRHLIFFALFYLFETDDLRSYRGCFLTICQICYFYLGGVNSTLLNFLAANTILFHGRFL